LERRRDRLRSWRDNSYAVVDFANDIRAMLDL